MEIGYLTTPPAPGTWIRPGSIHLETDRHAEAGEFTVSNQMRAWHRATSDVRTPERMGRLSSGVKTRCGRWINYDAQPDSSSWAHTQSVVAVTDAPGDAACARCERRPAMDRRFLQLLEDGFFAARVLANLMPEDQRPSDELLRLELTKEILRRGMTG